MIKLSYNLISQHVQLSLTPMRWFPNIIEWIFGDDNEYQGYIKIAKELGNWVKLYWQKYNK